MKIFLHKNDLPLDVATSNLMAIDTEAMGLNNFRDRLCLVQINFGNDETHLVQFEDKSYSAPNLIKLLSDDKIIKIMHFARFDVSIIYQYLGVLMKNIYCTKIASKIARTYTDKHGLKDLVKELLGVNLSKEQQSTYWGNIEISKEQMEYAASDVLHLHKLKSILDSMLERESRFNLFKECCNFLPYRSLLDIKGWGEDIFAH